MTANFDPLAFANRQTPEVKTLLLDRARVKAIHDAAGSIRKAAKEIGCGKQALSRALDYHGIKKRPPHGQAGVARKAKAQPKPAVRRKPRREWGEYRRLIERVTLEAYRESDRCPPACPGRDGCLTGRCVYE